MSTTSRKKPEQTALLEIAAREKPEREEPKSSARYASPRPFREWQPEQGQAHATADSPDVVAQNLARLAELQGPTGLARELAVLAADTGNVGRGLPFEYSTESTEG